MDLLEVMQNRRSVRKYKVGVDSHVSNEVLTKILQAGLLSPSGKAAYPWEFIVVRDRATLNKMAQCRSVGAGMLTEADAAVVIVADPEKSTVWIEDCSAAITQMHLMASCLGIGSCWIQGRLREAADGRTTEEFLRELLDFPESYKLEAILSLGMPLENAIPPRHELADLHAEKIRYHS